MNVKRFTARTSREALSQVRISFGADAVVLSTRPCDEGIEVLAMAPESVSQIARAAVPSAALPAARAPAGNARPVASAARSETAVAQPAQANAGSGVAHDVERLAMSTLSFQDYVRERLLRRRKAALTADNDASAAANERAAAAMAAAPARAGVGPAATRAAASPQAMHAQTAAQISAQMPAQLPAHRVAHRAAHLPAHLPAHMPDPVPFQPSYSDDVPAHLLREDLRLPDPLPSLAEASAGQRERTEVMDELRSVKGLIEERFSALAFMEQLHRNPRLSAMSQHLLEAGFSPALIRKLVECLPREAVDEMAWAAAVLQRNLLTDEPGPAFEDMGGAYALIGATGVGKTTSTAKIAASFAARHGAANLGLITLDAYRVAAHEQLRIYGRILGVPVHTAHDRASLDDLLDLLSAKKLVLIDTAGMAQRDERTRELLEMLSHRSIQRVLVLNAATQGETIDDVMQFYGAATCRGAILSKIDETVKLAPALDALVRHKLRVLGVANGQRVPEDWHRLSAQALIQRALRVTASPTWRVDASELNLVFAASQRPRANALRA